MSKKDLLKYANDEKPTEFAKEFKIQLDRKIQIKLSPEESKKDDDNEGDDK